MKALRTAAFVVGAAALVATGIGVAAGAGLLGAAAASGGVIAGVATAATFTAIGTALSVASGVAGLILAASAPKGTVGGNATKFKIDKEAGIPVCLGRTYVGGNVVHRQYYNNPTSKMKNQLESWVTVLSLGPVQSIGPLLVDKSPVSFDAGGAALGTFRGNMWLRTQYGACPEGAAMQGPYGFFPGWSASSKLSGLAADLWSLDFDSKGEKFPNGVPERGRVLEGVRVYDPRQDSTYPGGSGACRLSDPSTYVYSECPGPHAITWAHGYYQNGVLLAGGGLDANGIDMAPFVEWSNVCDANGWKVGGLVYSQTDDAWDVLKMICQAGSAEPLPVGAQLSVVFSAPRVSIGTLVSNDIMGDIDLPATVSRRVRRNTMIPSVRLESHGWEMVPLDPVVVPAYVAIDGGSRPKEVTYPLVQNATQGAQLALYEMLNDRELDGIVVPAKVYALGYRPGDCITLQVPEANLIGREVVVRSREIDGSTMGATLTCRTEDRTKHDFALGKTGTPPATPDLSNPGIDRSAPPADDWSVVGTTLTGDNVAVPALVVTGSAVRLNADEVIFDYRPYAAGAAPDAGWTGASLEPATVSRKEITSVTAATSYEVGVRYRIRGALSDRLILGPVTTGDFAGIGDGAGVPGPPGEDGKTSYVHFAYANSEDGVIDFSIGQPEGRIFIGTYTDFNVADSGDPNAYSWSRYGGPALFGLVGDGCVVAGNTVIKTRDGYAFNAGAYSTESWTGGAFTSFRFDPLGTQTLAGLNSDAASNDYAGIDFGVIAFESGDCSIWTGAGLGPALGKATAATLFGIRYDDKRVQWYKDGLLAYEMAATSGLTLFFDSALMGGTRVTDISFGPAGGAGASGFTLSSVANVAVTGSSITKNGGQFGVADGKARTLEAYPTASVTGLVSGVGAWVGLTTDPTASAGADTVDYYLFRDGSNGGDCYVYSNTQFRAFVGNYPGPSVRFGVTSDSRSVGYFVNGVEVHRHLVNGANEMLYGVWGVSFPGQQIADVGFSSSGKAGADGRDGLDGKNGLDGTNGQSIHIAYADSADGAVNFTTGAAGGRTYIGVYTDTNPGADSENPASYGWTRLRGIDGTNGLAGPGGYVHIAYADSADGTVNFHLSDPTGRRYLGTYTDQTEPDSSDPARYAWSLVKGADGVDGEDGTDGFIADTETPNWAIPCYPNGTVKPSWAGGSGTISLRKGATIITAGVTYSIGQQVNMAGLSLSGQTYSFGGIVGEAGFFFINAIYNGIIYSRRIDVKKTLDGSPAFRSTATLGASSTFNGQIDLGGGSTVIPANSTVTIAGGVTYPPPNSGNANANFRGRLHLYYRNVTDNGPLNYLGYADGSFSSRTNTGTPAEPILEETNGSANASFSFASASADKSYQFLARLEGNPSSPFTVDVTGSILAAVS